MAHSVAQHCSSSPNIVVDGSREVTMDFFQHRYYRLNKTLMTLIGQWPYQSTRDRRSFLAVIALISISQIIPVTLAIVKYRDDGKILFDCALPCFIGAACMTKFLGFIWNPQKTLKLLSRIRTDWQLWAQDREVNILHQYAEQGQKMVVGYIAMNITSLVIFMSEPVIPKIMDVILQNGTEPGKLPWPIDYYRLDIQKYYFFIMMHTLVCASIVAIVFVTSDAMLISYVQHVCGIFAALGQKLERIGSDDTSVKTGESLDTLDKRDIAHLASCIKLHTGAIDYANLIAASYKWIFFFTLGFGMVLINVLGLQILMTTTDPEETTKFIAFALATTLHFYIECHISQILVDHSNGVRFHIINSQWYKLSPKAQKLLQLMMMRCRIPCQVTAGKMFIMCMRTFGLTLRTALSYFTFVRSTQEL